MKSMKIQHVGRNAFLPALLLGLMLAAPLMAGMPLPSFRYFGMLSDEFGWPVVAADNAVIILRIGTNECARYTADERIGFGVNYILEVPMETSAGARYARYSARQGDAVSITVLMDGVEKTLMNSNSIPTVGSPGTATRVDLNLGEDTDHDGLSDLWETLLIINNSGGLYTNITQVLPGDDFDGDHSSNLSEFLAGTAPEWAGDVFQVEDWMRAENGQVALCFYTVRGNSYQLFESPSAATNPALNWARTVFQTTATGDECLSMTAEQSARTFFYVTPSPTSVLYRLEIIK